ncbi:MAG TPA: hypothetical protein VFM48_00960, partial [Aquabacterium sp.]|nr:hypothetical protein [Aquabacterium sp.]
MQLIRLSITLSASCCLLPVFANAATATPPIGHGQVYQCTAPTGKVTYQHAPCPENSLKVTLLDVTDARTDAQVRQARTINETQARVARDMARERKNNERKNLAANSMARPLAVHHRQDSTTTKADPRPSNLIPKKRDFRAIHKPNKNPRGTTNQNNRRADSPAGLT